MADLNPDEVRFCFSQESQGDLTILVGLVVVVLVTAGRVIRGVMVPILLKKKIISTEKLFDFVT